MIEWFFPFYCLGCGLEDNAICDECLERVPRLEGQVCPYCRVLSIGGRTCDFCAEGGAALDGLAVASVYEKRGLIARCLHNFKYNCQLEFGIKLGQFMNKFMTPQNFDFLKSDTIICPIPLFPAKEKMRGFNQSEILAQELAFSKNRKNLLKRVSYEKAQMTLNGEERTTNVKGVFEVLEIIDGAGVVLIDDVATTLATLEEAARTLRNAGFVNVYALVLAREEFEIETQMLK